MTEPLAQARALLEHFKSEVVPESQVSGLGNSMSKLVVPVLGSNLIVVRVFSDGGVPRVSIDVPRLPEGMTADNIARVGGMLIQISNLVRQIRVLAGGNASDSSRSETAV